LGSSSPGLLVQARETLHHAAQLLALAGASYLEPRDDDSHTSMSWVPEQHALATQPIQARTMFRFGLRADTLDLLLLDNASRAVRTSFSLDGRTRTEALAWMRSCLAEIGLPPEGLRTSLHFAIAPDSTDRGEPFRRPSDGSLDELANWYADAAIVLEAERASRAGAEPVRCWPHHFDIATLVRLPSPGKLQTVGIGLSPGDASFTEPYFYVGPYPAPTATLRSLEVGMWHTGSWWGAALSASDVVNQASSHEQSARVRAFISGAVERLLEYN
jgi:hypothetical protein